MGGSWLVSNSALGNCQSRHNFSYCKLLRQKISDEYYKFNYFALAYLASCRFSVFTTGYRQHAGFFWNLGGSFCGCRLKTKVHFTAWHGFFNSCYLFLRIAGTLPKTKNNYFFKPDPRSPGNRLQHNTVKNCYWIRRYFWQGNRPGEPVLT